MTREIKFRGKRLDNGEWIQGRSIVKLGNGAWISDFTSASIRKSEFFNLFTEVDLATVGQFTGLFDKNGKEIYDGDIIDNSSITGSVYFEDGSYWVGGLWLADISFPIVIGSIHDNPELLKTE